MVTIYMYNSHNKSAWDFSMMCSCKGYLSPKSLGTAYLDISMSHASLVVLLDCSQAFFFFWAGFSPVYLHIGKGNYVNWLDYSLPDALSFQYKHGFTLVPGWVGIWQ